VTFESRPDLTALSDYVAGVLRQLGYPTTVRHGLTHDQYVAREIDPKTMDQLTMFNWLPDFVAPSEFISVLFTCPSPGAAGGRLSQFCDRDFDRRVAAAERLEAGDPANALPAWSALDRRVTDLAPAVPVVTPRGLDFSSARLGNYESTGTGLRLVDEMWVR
jgi:peptide/nickel transport system substrate-binding protein